MRDLSTLPKVELHLHLEGDLVTAYVARAAAGGVRHVEAFFDPQPHLARGVPLQRVLDGLTSGIAGQTATASDP